MSPDISSNRILNIQSGYYPDIADKYKLEKYKMVAKIKWRQLRNDNDVLSLNKGQDMVTKCGQVMIAASLVVSVSIRCHKRTTYACVTRPPRN